MPYGVGKNKELRHGLKADIARSLLGKQKPTLSENKPIICLFLFYFSLEEIFGILW